MSISKRTCFLMVAGALAGSALYDVIDANINPDISFKPSDLMKAHATSSTLSSQQLCQEFAKERGFFDNLNAYLADQALEGSPRLQVEIPDCATAIKVKPVTQKPS